MTITIEFLFKILNTILWMLIPIAMYSIIKRNKKYKKLVNSRISNLEKKVNGLESRQY